MLFNSKTVAILIALVIGIVTASCLAMVNGIETWPLVVGFLASTGATFIVCYLTLELLFFKELRIIYSIFQRAKGEKFKMEGSLNKPLNVMRKELVAFSKDKDEEINKLKKLENFRREFLADISHELKTPIFAAQGFIHTLLDGAMSDKTVRKKFLKRSAKSLDQLDNLVQDLVAISQLETGEIRMELEVFDLGILVDEIFEQLENKAKKRGVSLSIIKDDPHILAIADLNRIMQVFKNLIDNAIKYGHEDGHVKVELHCSENSIFVTISDDGPGIPKEHQSQVFKRFYRVDKSRSRDLGGTGLGLAIVKHILEAHGSKIKLKSELGLGTSFTFKLQRGYEDAENEIEYTESHTVTPLGE